MNGKVFTQIANDLGDIKRLLVLLLQHQKVKGVSIAKALKVTKGRVSQMISTKKFQKGKRGTNG